MSHPSRNDHQQPHANASGSSGYVISAPPDDTAANQPSHDGEVYYDEDAANMAEIEREMAAQGGYYNEEDAQHMNEIEQELDNVYQPTDAYQPVNQAGALSAHAAEFWFPESRNCSCCKGFKHGCPCIKAGVTVCQNASCTSTTN